MELRIVGYDDISPNTWDEFVYANMGGWSYYLYDVIALDRYINDKNISFCIWDDYQNEIVLIAQLHIENRVTETESFYRLHSRWGYVIKDGLTKKLERKVCQKYREHIDELYRAFDVRSFNASMPPLSRLNYPDISVVNPLVKIGFIPSVRYTWIVELEGEEESLLMNCEQTTRQSIRKFKANDMYKVIESDGSKADFLAYKYLHEQTYTRTGAARDIIYDEYHENIFYNLIPQKKCKVFFLKELDSGKCFAANIILLYKNTGYYWWGCSLNEREVGMNKYLLWESMMNVKNAYEESNSLLDENMPFVFETGGAYPYRRKGKLKGLNDFKKCFGCKLHPIYTGMYDY